MDSLMWVSHMPSVFKMDPFIVSNYWLSLFTLCQAVISTRRLSRFLSCSEHKYEVELMADSSSPDLLNEQSAAIFKDMSIAIHDACCAWSCSNEKEWNMVLNHVTLELPKGSFVAVIGEVRRSLSFSIFIFYFFLLISFKILFVHHYCISIYS